MYIFYFISFIAFYYFVCKKRKFDFFSISYLSSLIYFSPAFFGRVSYRSNFIRISEKMIDEVYYVYFFVLFSLIFFAFMYDKTKTKIEDEEINKHYSLGVVSIFLSIILLILLIASQGSNLLNPNKGELMLELGLFMNLFIYSSLFSFVISFLNGQKKILFIAILLQLFIMLIGFRFPLVISLACIVLAKVSSLKRIRLIKYKKSIFFSVLFLVLILVFKQFIYAIKQGDFELIISLLNNQDYLMDALIYAEPFETQSILNEVIKTNFEVPLSHLDQFLAFFIFESTTLGIDISSFNSYFQHRLFPGVRSGMASNIWAQFFAIGSYYGVALFVIFYNLIVIFLNNLLTTKSVILKSVILITGIFWCFYLQRNDLSYIFSTQKKILLFGLGLALLTKLFFSAKSTKK